MVIIGLCSLCKPEVMLAEASVPTFPWFAGTKVRGLPDVLATSCHLWPVMGTSYHYLKKEGCLILSDYCTCGREPLFLPCVSNMIKLSITFQLSI